MLINIKTPSQPNAGEIEAIEQRLKKFISAWLDSGEYELIDMKRGIIKKGDVTKLMEESNGSK